MSYERKLIFLFIGIGLLLAAGIFVFINYSSLGQHPVNDFFDFVGEFVLNLSVAIIFLFASGYLMAPALRKSIKKRKINPYLAGILFSFLVLFIGTFFGSLVGFFTEAPKQIHASTGESFFDYVIKPLFWVFYMGGLPTLLLGIILGRIIKKRR